MNFKKVNKAKKLAVLMSGILQSVPSFVTSTVVTTAFIATVANKTAEMAQALEIQDIFNFAKSKGIKERISIKECNNLIVYDKANISEKPISKTCEKYKVERVIKCVNNFDKLRDEESKKCIALFLDRIAHGLDKISYDSGLEAMARFLKGDKSDLSLYKLGWKYVQGCIVQYMLYQSAVFACCWSLEQNYISTVLWFCEYITLNDIDIREETLTNVLNEKVKNFVLSLFEGTENEPIGVLEQTIFDIQNRIMIEHIEKYASKKPILPEQVNLKTIKNHLCNLENSYEIDTNDISWDLRAPKKILEDTALLHQKLTELKKAIYRFEILSKSINKINKNNDVEYLNFCQKVLNLDHKILLRFKNIVNSDRFKVQFGSYDYADVFPELTFTIQRITDILYNDDYYSASDLQYCEKIEQIEDELNILHSFDYENFYRAIGIINATAEICSSPKDVATFLRDCFMTGPYCRGKKGVDLSEEDFTDDDWNFFSAHMMILLPYNDFKDPESQKFKFNDANSYILEIGSVALGRLEKSFSENGIMFETNSENDTQENNNKINTIIEEEEAEE